ncbi:MAG: glutamate--tRNA ligase [Thermodesulfobacteriota bacterium]
MTGIRTRFAPSPTGHLHVGGARTALFNWLLARSQGGTFVLRIEDTDAERSTVEYTQAILEAMTWLGLDWDEGPFFQTQRTDVYREYIQKMLDQGRAYWCHCRPEELTERRRRAMEQGRKPKYDGLCREKGLGPASGAVVRFKGPLTGVTHWDDLIKGPIAFDHEELDDLVILRSDGLPTYNLAVVVDDITMGMTHVIRGDDHVNNTPRQILLYQALVAPLPLFGHVPMILGADKTRLSKRHGATSVMAYKEMGYLPEALVNYLVRLGWSYGDDEIFSLQDLVKKFSLENVGRSAGVFSPEKLLWLNAHYIKESSLDRLARLAAPYLEKEGLDASDPDYLARAAATVRTRARTVIELAEMIRFYLKAPEEYEAKAVPKLFTPDTASLLAELRRRIESLSDFTEKALEEIFSMMAEERGFKLGQIAQPARLALTGKTASPGLFEVMTVLGRERVLDRLARAEKFIQSRP